MAASDTDRRELSPLRAMVLPIVSAGALAALGLTPAIRQNPGAAWSFLSAAAGLVLWAGGLFVRARREGRRFTLSVDLYKHHWLQGLTQLAIILYWGWHVRFVYAFLPFMLAQILFAYGVHGLLDWSRREHHSLGAGPIPIILSINLFLWFRPEWFYWQFALILVGYLAKEFIRWERGGRSRHIFNPSSFPLAVASIVLLALGATDATFGTAIAQTQYNPPRMYLFIFLVSIPVQVIFGVARVTLAAVVTILAVSYGYFEVTGTYLFYDAFITVPVFLGAHLLITDPSTSPRSESGLLGFGVLYGLAVLGIYWVLAGLGLPRFYDKLLPVPILNLMVRGIDGVARSEPLARLNPARLGDSLASRTRYGVYTAIWAGVFVFLSASGGVDDEHPGQFLPFWLEACSDGSDRACEYVTIMTANYCDQGSGWACNEWGVFETAFGRADVARGAFRRSCELGFDPGCRNARRAGGGSGAVDVRQLARDRPRVEDLPIVLRGSRGPIETRDPDSLFALACERGWPGFCERTADAGSE
ncbi:MAG: hypothetical protein Q8W44_01980 [Candidatus Palauibacterales bacterium]|nr:hypothetical protein [Candidatus Palauibacterales bacterium]